MEPLDKPLNLRLKEKKEIMENIARLSVLCNNAAIVYSVQTLLKIPKNYENLAYAIVAGICFSSGLRKKDGMPNKYRNFIMSLLYPECKRPIPEFTGKCEIYHSEASSFLMNNFKTFKTIVVLYLKFYLIPAIWQNFLTKFNSTSIFASIKDYLNNVVRSTVHIHLFVTFTRLCLCLMSYFNIPLTKYSLFGCVFLSSFPSFIERKSRVGQITKMFASYYLIAKINHHGVSALLFLMSILQKKSNYLRIIFALISGWFI
jgi:hypothetical protein